MKWLLYYLLFMNLVTYISFGMDKKRAQKRLWRISEKRLLGMAVIGGGVGGWLGMFMFHHKTKKWPFRILVPIFTLIQVGIVGYYWSS
ncbi:DUF1294 domain-containing protein [Ammoniphilus resinae]|uniref:Uncharacterized membrane protein YsdA (DUF1294 family) n=1 Tax=Ammoniphilus resinae TaxID=861532 RepID=A0ABS4GR39_9BACL|nr:DUF1294 domain-containing protein [Ammoniphilus resinae]MBP1932733.1 uncharacterized membrane protein YsdA (DUF1294 family) [Ammoniphilus resinae]